MAASNIEPIIIDGHPFRSVKEGKASILAPYRSSDFQKSKGTAHKGASHNNDEGNQAVFYNPIQQYNRDLSVLAILVYGEGLVFDKQSKRHSKGDKDKVSNKKRKKQNGIVGESRDNPPEAFATLSEGKQSVKRKASEAGIGGSEADAELRKRSKGDDDAKDDIAVKELQSTVPHNDAALEKVESNKPPAQPQRPESQATEKAAVSFTILDALSASGLRAIRYAKEIPFATTIIANDLSPDAVKSIDFNIDYNDLKSKVFSNVGDARQYMYSKTGNWTPNSKSHAIHVHRFDVIDLDPYGTAAPFLDAAIQAISDGGMLCVTCTDAGVFASNGYPEKCYALYGGIPMKGAHSHEAGLRLILHAVATSAAKYGMAIEPMLSLSIDFYARLFIRIHKSQQDVKLLAGTTMNVYNCDQGCGAWETQLLARNQERKDRLQATFYKHSLSQAPSAEPHCEHCGTKTHLAGPMWAGPIHNPYFVQRIIDKLPNVDHATYSTTERIKGMLTLALEEDSTNLTTSTLSESSHPKSNTGKDKPSTDLAIITTTTPPSPSILRLPPNTLDPTPFFHLPSGPSKALHASTPSEPALRGALLHLGYRVTRSHCKPGSIKTNAPWKVLWEIYREWVVQKDGGQARIDKLLGKNQWEGKAQLSRGTAGWRILRRLRSDKETLDAMRIVEDVRSKLGWEGKATKSLEGAEDVREILRSALYQLEHPTKEFGDSSDVSDGKNVTETNAADSDVNGHADGAKIPPTSPEAGSGPEVKDVSKLKIVFDTELGKERRERLVRYQINPRANWGPMNRAGGL